eukprot:TRINITY_DN8345_c0_g1_i4.p1 TRINITY_DN8345_c0_g1~~TRINITY_DN8345_c0_g1_i4.p1  ORF type:complete len:258 (-),score=84.43 TRINITY_DN8345_c0_g1_i4:93-866(-)
MGDLSQQIRAGRQLLQDMGQIVEKASSAASTATAEEPAAEEEDSDDLPEVTLSLGTKRWRNERLRVMPAKKPKVGQEVLEAAPKTPPRSASAAASKAMLPPWRQTQTQRMPLTCKAKALPVPIRVPYSVEAAPCVPKPSAAPTIMGMQSHRPPPPPPPIATPSSASSSRAPPAGEARPWGQGVTRDFLWQMLAHGDEQWRERPGHAGGGRLGNRGGRTTWWFQMREKAKREGYEEEFHRLFPKPLNAKQAAMMQDEI